MDINPLSDTWCKYFLTFCKLPFFFHGFLCCAEAFKFDVVPLVYFCFFCLCFKCHIQKIIAGTSLAVRWLGLRASTAGAQIQSLVGELRYHVTHGTAQKIKINKINHPKKIFKTNKIIAKTNVREIFFPVFSSSSCMISSLTFKSLIHFCEWCKTEV